jgi:hypothetical protein
VTYEQKLVALLATGRLHPGEIHRLDVKHSDDCPRLRGGSCQCDPKLVLDGKKIEVLPT